MVPGDDEAHVVLQQFFLNDGFMPGLCTDHADLQGAGQGIVDDFFRVSDGQ